MRSVYYSVVLVVQYSTVHSTVQCGTQYSVVHVVQYSTVHSTVYSTVQCGTCTTVLYCECDAVLSGVIVNYCIRCLLTMQTHI